MIIINKKRILLILSSVILSLFVFTLFKKDDINSNASEQVVSLPESSKTVILDAGHGTPDEGAESSSRHNRGTN